MSTQFHILPKEQQQLWPLLHNVNELGFVLYGGTAVALHCGHRDSVDFDFFSSFPFTNSDIYRILPFLEGSEITQSFKNTFTVAFRQTPETRAVKLSFFGGIGFGRIGEPVLTDDGNLWIASKPDLLALKLATFMVRVETKDYLDIAALLTNGANLKDGLIGAQTFYKSEFPPSIVLSTLLCFDDLNPPLDKKNQRLLSSFVRQMDGLPHPDDRLPLKSRYLCSDQVAHQIKVSGRSSP